MRTKDRQDIKETSKSDLAKLELEKMWAKSYKLMEIRQKLDRKLTKKERKGIKKWTKFEKKVNRKWTKSRQNIDKKFLKVGQKRTQKTENGQKWTENRQVDNIQS